MSFMDSLSMRKMPRPKPGPSTTLEEYNAQPLQQQWKRGLESNQPGADYGFAVRPLNYPAMQSCSHPFPGRRRCTFQLAETQGGTAHKISLFLCKRILPLGNPATCQTYGARQFGRRSKQFDGFGLGHGTYV